MYKDFALALLFAGVLLILFSNILINSSMKSIQLYFNGSPTTDGVWMLMVGFTLTILAMHDLFRFH